MTHISTPNVGALPRQRTRRPGRLMAIAMVIALGAAIGVGITVTGGDASPANPSANTFTAQREGQLNPPSVNGADQGYLGFGAERSAEEALKHAVKQGQVPAQAFQPSAGYAEQPGQPR